MESVWGGTNSAPNFPGWTAPPGHSSLWVDPVAKGIKTEQDILEEQLRAEEKKKEELRKQEELQRIQEVEERKRQLEEEELTRRRKEEEEREKEKERKRIQEEERKKKEAAAAKKAEQDRLKKEEEKKRKEEEKRKKEEEKKKQEEEKKRVEEEKKRVEEERKKREEMAKRQNEALKRLQEQQQQARVVKPVPAPWTAPEPAGPSLVEIQKTERKQQQQLREQQEMLQAYQEKHQQEQQLKITKSLNLKWAEQTGQNQSTRVKSLAEIQAEEHERMAKQAEKEKAERMAAAKDVPPTVTGSIWSSTTQRQSASGGVWGNTSTVANAQAPCFWDEVKTKAAKPQQQAAAVPNKSQAKTKAKKEEASVMKLFEKQLTKSSKSDELIRWCSKTLASCSTPVDIPTFVDFLLSFESQKEVRDYIIMCLGNTQDINNFASEFIERRSRLFSVDQSTARSDPPPTPTHSFQEVKVKHKKVKKGKMTKVDNRILGFNVTAAPDRINVGDRDYGEGL